MLSAKFLAALNAATLPKYKIARLAGCNPVTFWKLTSGFQEPRHNDERLIKVAKLLGLRPDEVFETEISEAS